MSFAFASDRARRVASLVVLMVGCAATAASNGPLFGPGLSADEGPMTLTLSSSAPDAQVPFSALLDAQAPLTEGSGEVGVQVELDPGAVLGLSFGLSSDVTGESNSTDIIDPSAQDQARVGIEAFAGCSGDSACEEGFSATFALIGEGEGELEVTWYVDASVSLELAEDEEPTGSLTLTVP